MDKTVQAEDGQVTPLQGRTEGSSPPRNDLPNFARRVVVAVLITLALLALAGLLWRGVHVLLEAFAGVLFGIFLSALAEWLHKHSRLSYGWSLAVVVFALLGLTSVGGWLLASRLATQLRELIGNLPHALEQLRAYLAEYAWGQFLLQELPQAVQSSHWSGELARGGQVISSLTAFLEAVLIIFIVGIFGAAEPDVYKKGLFHLVPPRQRRRVGQALDAVMFNLRWWLVGQVVLMVIVGGTTAVGLTLIGVPMALALGLIAGVMELIPYIGAWLSAVPAALMALTLGPWYVLMVLGLFLALHVLEGYVLLPLIQRRSVHLPPALTLVMQFLLGELLGLMGLFVAAPLTVAGVVLIKMFYVEDTLGDHNVNVPGGPGQNAKSEASAG